VLDATLFMPQPANSIVMIRIVEDNSNDLKDTSLLRAIPAFQFQQALLAPETAAIAGQGAV
jgi:hypothetical protein